MRATELMTKKKIRPHHQLFLFSNTLDPRVETWFKESVILEQEISRENESCELLKKLVKSLDLLDIGNFKYVTNVINYQSNNLLFVKLSGSYPVVCNFTTEKSYIELDRLYRLLTIWYSRYKILNHLFYYERKLLRNLKGSSLLRKNAYAKEKEVISLLESNDNAIKDLLAQEFIQKLTL